MNTTKILRSPKDKLNPFTRISKSIANLKAEEAGIMLQILSNSDSWVLNKQDVYRKSKLGKDRFEKVWNNLKQLGYIKIVKAPVPNGKFQYSYIIHEIPEIRNQDTDIEEPDMGFHSTENHNTEIGGTNNYYITRTSSIKQETGVDPRNGVEGDTCQYMLGPDEKSQFKNVPTPSLRCGEGRDINLVPLTGNSTNDELLGPDNNISSEDEFWDPVNNVPNEEVFWILDKQTPTEEKFLNPEDEFSFEDEFWDPVDNIPNEEKLWNFGEGISIEKEAFTTTKNIPDGTRIWSPDENNSTSYITIDAIQATKLKNEWIKEFTFPGDYAFKETHEFEPDEKVLNDFIEAIDDLYQEKFPNWEKMLRKMPVNDFLRKTSKVHTGKPEIVEMISIIHRKLK